MHLDALILSRLQFAFTIAFHIIFPSLAMGLAAWLVVLEGLYLATDQSIYRRLFDFWLTIFGLASGIGLVSGIVTGFEFGTNLSRLVLPMTLGYTAVAYRVFRGKVADTVHYE